MNRICNKGDKEKSLPAPSFIVESSTGRSSACESSYFVPRTPVRPRSNMFFQGKFREIEKGPHNISKAELDVSSYDSSIDLSYLTQCFYIIDRLGSGTFSEIYRVIEKSTGRSYAIKKIMDGAKGNLKDKAHEAKVLERIEGHINIIKFYSAWTECYETFLKLEVCYSDFAEIIAKKIIPEEEILTYMNHSLSGLKHLHENGYAHVDLKSENIFLGYDGLYKLADFGLSHPLNEEDPEAVTEGDSRYLAKELLQGQFGSYADIFSLGMTLVEALYHVILPGEGILWHRLRSGKFPEELVLKDNYSSWLLRHVRHMISPVPEHRPSAQSLLKWNNIKRTIGRISIYQNDQQLYKNRKNRRKSPYFCRTSSTRKLSFNTLNISNSSMGQFKSP